VSDREVIFFPNGNTGVFRDGAQRPGLQWPWLRTFVDWLEAQGEDPVPYRYSLPNGCVARLIRSGEGGYNWDISAPYEPEPPALIAAAPDLLAACKAVLQAYVNDDYRVELSINWAQLGRAVEKAEGRNA
jgi:hypothetical protein